MGAIDRWLMRFWVNQRANVAMLLKRNKAAMTCYRELLALNPRDEIARSTLGNLLMEAGDSTGAAAQFEQLVEINPDNAEAWFNLGYIYEQGERLDDAERCFRRAVALKPSIDRAWYGLGLVLIRNGRLREAVAALKKNTQLQPFSPYGFYQLAMTYHHLGESGEAWRIYEHLKTFEPRYAATLKRDMETTPPRGEAAPQSVPREAQEQREAHASAQ
jgi:tetratricopeptide (TPR) repeat protein